MATDKFQDLDMAVTWILEQAAGLNITPNSHPNPNQHRHLKHNLTHKFQPCNLYRHLNPNNPNPNNPNHKAIKCLSMIVGPLLSTCRARTRWRRMWKIRVMSNTYIFFCCVKCPVWSCIFFVCFGLVLPFTVAFFLV